MRTIKFRGKQTESKKWIYSKGVLIHNDGTVVMIEKQEKDFMFTSPVIPETVGQFTGLTDKNGVDIYEGDILKTRTLSDELNENKFDEYEVGFSGCSFCLIVNGHPVRQWKDGTHDWYSLENTESFEMEVTGNIHENKEP